MDIGLLFHYQIVKLSGAKDATGNCRIFSPAKYVLTCCFLLSVFFATGQTSKDTRQLAMLERYYQTGDYKVGLKLTKEFKKSSIRKTGENTLEVTRYHTWQAIFEGALSNFESYNELLKSAESSLQSAEKTDVSEHALAVHLLCEAYFITGNCKRVDSLLTSFKSISSSLPDSDPMLLELRYDALRLRFHQMYLNKGLNEADAFIKKAYSRIVLRDSVSKKGVMKFVKLSSFELNKRRELYSRLVLVKVRLYESNGKTDSASTLLEQHIDWLHKNLDYRAGHLAQAYYLKAMLAIDNDDFRGAHQLLTKASGAAVKFYKTNAPFYAQIQKMIITNLMELDKREEATQRNNDLDVKIRSYHGRRSLAYMNNSLIDVDREIMNQSWKRAARHLDEYLADTKHLPAIHKDRLPSLLKSYSVSLRMNQIDKAEKCINDALMIAEALYGKNSPAYHMYLLQLAEFDTEYSDNYKKAEEIYNISFDSIIRNEVAHSSPAYYNNVYGEARLFEVLERYTKAYALFEDILKETEENAGKNSVQYVVVLERFANLDITTGNYPEAEKKINEALAFYEQNKKSRHSGKHIITLETLARLQIVQGKYDEASSTFLRVKIKKLLRSPDLEELSGGSPEEFFLLNIYLGKYRQTEKALSEFLESREKRFGKKHRSLISTLNYLGYMELVTGDYNKAEEYLSRASSISEELFGENSIKYASTLVYLKRLYTAIGDYDKAEKAIQKVVDIYIAQFGEDHIKVGIYLHELGLAKFFNSSNKKNITLKTDSYKEENTRGLDEVLKKKKVEKLPEKKLQTSDVLFNNSFRIINDKLGDKNPEFAQALENASVFYMNTGKLDVAYEAIEKARAIWVSVLGEQNINAARINFVIGNIMYLKNNYAEALKYFEKSRSMYADLFDDRHPGYIEAQGKCAQMHYILGDVKSAVASSQETIDKSLTYIDEIFPGLSERGKSNYWDKVKQDFEFYKTLAFTQQERYPDMVGKVYDMTLRTKSILLNSSLKVKQRILTSGDTVLINNYEAWLGLKEDLGAAISMSAAQRKTAEIDLAKMEAQIEALERKLSVGSDVFAKNYEKISYEWPMLKKALSKNEIAIEVVPFRYFDKKFTDTIWYAVMAVSSETKNNPDYIIIKNGSEIDRKMIKYYRNCIKFEVDDEKSYDAYWAPLKPLIGNNSNVIYFSSDGVYNQLNLETLKSPDGNYLINTNNIILIGSTRDLIDRYTRRMAEKKKAAAMEMTSVALVGNPSYYAAGDTTHHAVTQLPGAENEIRQLNEIVSGKWKSEVFLNDAATEESVKQLSSPKIFHIATHGFFLEDSESGELDELTEKAVQNPLLRSGLLMKNGGQLLQNENVFAFNKEDGILTAYEAMNLNFDNTDLVVLSACETGLGEVKLGEGVIGLQRSFLVAGAETLIMTLFKVSDQVTIDLMTSFYQKWLTTGNKRASLVEAKKEVMQKYNNPKYWGSFVMVGLD